MKEQKKKDRNKRLTGIKSRLILFFASISLVSSLGIGILAIDISSDIVISDSNRSITYLAKEAAKVEESRLETRRESLKIIANLEDIKSMNWELQKPLLNDMNEDAVFVEIGIINMEGNVKYSNGNTYNLSMDSPLRKALDGDDAAIDFTISQETGELALLQAIPIKDNNRVVGAILGHSDGKALSDMAADVGYGTEGYGYMVDGKGTAIGHPNIELVLERFNPLEAAKSDNSLASLGKAFELILGSDEGVTSYSYNGGDQYVGYSKINGTDWTFVLVASRNEILASIPLLRNDIFLTSGFVLVISIVLTYIIGNSITTPIIKTVGFAKKISDLNLSENIPSKLLKKKDEVGILANALQEIISGVRNIIYEINNSTDLLSASSQELTATAAQSSNASQEIAKTVEEIADGAAQQAKHTEDGFMKASYLAQTIENVQKYINRVNESSSKVTNVVEEGLQEINSLDTITKESIEAINEIYRNDMNGVRQNILEVLENLSAIAEENAAASEEASAATEEQTASIEEIASASDSLSELASKLHEIVVKFKL